MERNELKRKIIVFDDEPSLAEGYVDRLEEVKAVSRDFDVESVTPNQFPEIMNILKGRQLGLRLKSRNKHVDLHTPFDDADVAIIDYYLLRDPKSALMTGENVAYLVRCFSDCKLLIGLNQFSRSNFDLSLRGHPDSFVDFNIGSKQIANPRLWGEDGDGFRPSYWPNVNRYLSTFNERIDDVLDNMDRPVLDVLALSNVANVLPLTATGFLSGGTKHGGDITKTNFRQFLFESGSGFRGRDRGGIKASKESMARIIAARLSKWLERLVLPGQDVLVSPPHLVSRYPSLLRGEQSNLNSWNRTTGFGDPNQLGLRASLIKDFQYGKPHWLSRSAWLWPLLSSYKEIPEVQEPWKRELPPYVFCEDDTRFHKKGKEFLSEVDSPYVRRYVHEYPGIDYQPAVHFLEA